MGPARKGSIEKKSLLGRIDRLFRISPIKVKAKDGSNEQVAIEHRLGTDAGFFTGAELMKKLGLEDEYAEYVLDMQKKIRDKDRLKEVLDDKYRLLKSKMNRVVSDYRKYLEQFYGNYARPLLPMFAFVPVAEKADGLYLQGLADENTLKLVAGDPEDAIRWCETVFSKTKNWADLNKRAETQARALLSLPHLNKDLKHRAQVIAQGRLPGRLSFNGGK